MIIEEVTEHNFQQKFRERLYELGHTATDYAISGVRAWIYKVSPRLDNASTDEAHYVMLKWESSECYKTAAREVPYERAEDFKWGAKTVNDLIYRKVSGMFVKRPFLVCFSDKYKGFRIISDYKIDSVNELVMQDYNQEMVRMIPVQELWKLEDIFYIKKSNKEQGQGEGELIKGSMDKFL
jgi:hypothetical protein